MGTTAWGLSRDAMDCLRAYHWPGNIREMENILEMAVILANGPMIQPDHLAPRIRVAYAESPAQVAAPVAQPVVDNATLRDVELETIRAALQEYDCNISRVSRA